MASSIEFTEQSAADVPNPAPAGKQIMFADEDGAMYIVNDQGFVFPVGAVNEFKNVVIVNVPSDIPDELTNGGNVVYEVQCATMDLGTRNFTATGGSCVIRGSSRYESTLESSATGTLFSVNNANFAFESIHADAPNADYIMNFSGNGLVSLVMDIFVVQNCKKIATISGAFTTSIRTCAIVLTSVGGLEWTGILNRQINVTDTFSAGAPAGWAGSLFDLGTALFDLIVIGSGNRFISKVGNTILTGAASSANLNANGRALVSGSIFNGDGTPLSGITTQDLKWEFDRSVIFTDTSFTHTKEDADAFLLTQEIVTISGTGTYVAIAGGNWQSEIANRFTVNNDGEITFIGLHPIDIKITATATVEKSGGGTDVVATKIAIDDGGGGGYAVQNKTISTTQNSDPTGVISQGIFRVESGYKLQLFTANLTSTSNVIVSNSSIVITGM